MPSWPTAIDFCKLSDLKSPLAFSDGNSTFRISLLGFLHYATVELGSPGIKFMVAHDTGSGLFWVPCDCRLVVDARLLMEFELSVYGSKGSSTSKKVTCNILLFDHRNHCPGTFSDCPYMISYVSAQTSTSGILVEDVLHLVTGDINEELVEAYVMFGCEQVQSGLFLDIAAPNGLFGLTLFDSGTSFTCLVDPTCTSLAENTELVYCLAVSKSAGLNIVGCYDLDEYNTFPIECHISTLLPAVAAGFGYYPTSNLTKKTRNISRSSVVSPVLS
ncbi:aspartic proteinase-like protein 1-like isoform X4 [Tripterygium wilfordii]|uniref:Aspartic proteinase-like protein 1-like isoform X4 n=1 Tax=Tripterygium wilfordii TaxID=458696 RepID=A0A7J7CPA1_TRIWF|nr:aspartic proteinase-like protein 1-like isoform X4 [Tripterygium wilfordii]